jgi:hypothetical protein
MADTRMQLLQPSEPGVPLRRSSRSSIFGSITLPCSPPSSPLLQHEQAARPGIEPQSSFTAIWGDPVPAPAPAPAARGMHTRRQSSGLDVDALLELSKELQYESPMTGQGGGSQLSSSTGQLQQSNGAGKVVPRRYSHLTVTDLEKLYNMPLAQAAKRLSVSPTMLKKICRGLGVKRWPHRQLSSIGKTIERLQDKLLSLRGTEDADETSLLVLESKIQRLQQKQLAIRSATTSGLDLCTLRDAFGGPNDELDPEIQDIIGDAVAANKGQQICGTKRKLSEEGGVHVEGKSEVDKRARVAMSGSELHQETLPPHMRYLSDESSLGEDSHDDDDDDESEEVGQVKLRDEEGCRPNLGSAMDSWGDSAPWSLVSMSSANFAALLSSASFSSIRSHDGEQDAQLGYSDCAMHNHTMAIPPIA